MNEGTRVVDSDAEGPNDAVVVWRPADMTTADWTYEPDGDTCTTAESNPDDPDNEQLVVVAFERTLEEAWPEWTTADSDNLYEDVKEQNIPLFGSPSNPWHLRVLIDQQGRDPIVWLRFNQQSSRSSGIVG